MPRPPWPALASSILFLWAGVSAAQSVLPVGSVSAPSAAGSVGEDPYLWLEKVDSSEAMNWVRSENEKTMSVLEADPRFANFESQSLAIESAADRIPVARRIDGGLWNFWQDVGHVRGIWRVASPSSYDAGGVPRWRTVLDLDKLSASENANWVWKGAQCEATHERKCLVELSDGGEDAAVVREFDLRKGRFVAGGFELPRSKQSAVWEGKDALVVAREWVPGELTKSGYPFVVKRLRRGQALAQAVEVFRGSASDARLKVRSFSDARGRQAVVIQRGVTFFEWETSLLTPSGARRLNLPRKSSVVGLFDGQLIVKIEEAWHVTGQQFSQGSLVAINLAQALATPEALRPASVVAPTTRQSVQGVSGTKAGLLVTMLDNVRGRASMFTRSRDGTWKETPIPLPDDTTVEISDASPHSATAYLSVSGYLRPESQWRVDGDGMRAKAVRSLPAQFDASREAVVQFEAVSSDGTPIPYTVVHPRDMPLDGTHPTILHAYGGFAVPESPSYSGTVGKLWLDRGGVYVVANIRGGGEFGPPWHEAGLKTKRQIVYDDFATVARDLIARGVTSTRRLGIMGASNGGLLMGVEMTQHPELWSAVDIGVPLLDMQRFEQIAAGALWVGEYGSMSKSDERALLEKISPYNNLRRDVKYPLPLVWTTTKDDRVGPQHARKFAARLAQYGIPYYFYEFTEGGHGADANLQELARTDALEYIYLARQLMDR